MIDLYFDTETTGMTPKDRIVQIAGMLCEGDLVRATIGLILKQTRESHEKAFAAHGLTLACLEEHGFEAAGCMRLFSILAGRADRIIAHNTKFDVRLVRQELIANGMEDCFLSKPLYCTMETTTPLLKLPNPNPRYSNYKWPSLMEAYKALVDERGFEGAHDALNDVRACWAVARALEAQGHQLVQI